MGVETPEKSGGSASAVERFRETEGTLKCLLGGTKLA